MAWFETRINELEESVYRYERALKIIANTVKEDLHYCPDIAAQALHEKQQCFCKNGIRGRHCLDYHAERPKPPEDQL